MPGRHENSIDGQLLEVSVARVLSELAGRGVLAQRASMGTGLGHGVMSVGVACDGCPSFEDLMKRYDAAGGELLVCPICFNARRLNEDTLVTNARIGGTVPMWEWIGDGATTFSY